MPMRSSRHLELDFLRGLALLLILVDHIGGSVLTHVTLHAYALCDASEVFVFLGGLSSAIAYDKRCARSGAAHAQQRLLRRAAQLYLAFLLTAGLMLIIAAGMEHAEIDAPNLPDDDLDALLDAPLGTLRDIALLRRQPYLAGVLPMYACFALCAAWVLPLLRRKPLPVLAGSAALWACARTLAPYLPASGDLPWDFNPCAWQFLFVLGAFAYRPAWLPRLRTAPFTQWLNAAALVGLAGGAYARLVVLDGGLDAASKQNLDGLRLVNFAALAWLAWQASRRGWLQSIAERLSPVATIGRHGLPCFIAGAVISLLVDSLLYAATDGYMDHPRGLLADAAALALLYAVAYPLERRRMRRLPNTRAAAGAPAP